MSNRKGKVCSDARHAKGVFSLDKFVILIALMLLFSISLSSLTLAANPGHGAASIASGSFESGNYTFPDSMFITSYAGIGTLAPTTELDVNGSINVSGTSAKIYSPEICLAGSCITSWSGATLTESEVEAYVYDTGNALLASWSVTSDGTYDINFDSNTFVVDASADSVGIGTATPSKKLEVSNGTQSLTVDPTAANVTINTTASSDLVITSSGGNVVIQLG